MDWIVDGYPSAAIVPQEWKQLAWRSRATCRETRVSPEPATLVARLHGLGTSLECLKAQESASGPSHW
jgi:hypothetical protein